MSECMDYTCCIIGPGQLPDQHVVPVTEKVKREVKNALADGYKRFWLVLSGEASVCYGTGIKEAIGGQEGVTLEIMVPRHISVNQKSTQYTELTRLAAGFVLETEGETGTSLMIANNRVLDFSTRMIAVSDGTDEEMLSIISIAKGIDVPVHVITTE